MELDSLFGLPAHPLIVHAAVVLLPIAAVVTILTAGVPRWRQHYALVALGVALAATTAVGLAQGSGESLEEQVDETELVEEHAEQGEQVLPWAIGVTVVAAAVVAADRAKRRYPNLTTTKVTAILLVAATATGIGASWTVAEVGHSGAKATWDGVPTGEG